MAYHLQHSRSVLLAHLLMGIALIGTAGWANALAADSTSTTATTKAKALKTYTVREIVAHSDRRSDFRALRSVEGAAIYEAKKTELITPDELAANRAANNARQVFAKVAGLNVWESDGAGLQLGIGARGLSPNRTANFNTRQNGYDISADALGYPESYYTPPVEALERIEVVRGAASLQYGTQFGGMVNFVFKRGAEDRPLEVTTRQTLGSWGFWNSFNAVGGTVPVNAEKDSKVNYYAFYQHKQGNGWRPHSGFGLDMGFVSARYDITSALSLQTDYTIMRYVAQQPGGLTDAMFAQDPQQSVRARNWFMVDWQIAALTLDYALSAETRLNSRFFGVWSGREALGNLERINVVDFGKERTLLSDQYRNVGNETRLVHRYPLLSGISTLVAGARFYAGWTRRRQGDAPSGNAAEFRYLNPDNLENSDYVFPGSNIAAFAEHIVWLTPNLSVTPGVRFEHIATLANGYWRQRVFDFAGNVVADTRIHEQLERVRSFALFGVGVSYRFDTPSPKGLELYGNVSQNFRAITFSDLRVVNPNFKVDSALRDERGFNVDVGLRGNISSWLNVDASVFYLQYADRIGNVLRADEPPLYLPYRFRTNIGDSRTIGVEMLLEADFTSLVRELSASAQEPTWNVSAFVNAAVLDARYIRSNDPAVVGKFVELAPPAIVRSGITATWEQFQATVQNSTVAEHFTDATNAVRTSSAVNGIIPMYSVWDVSARYGFSLWERACVLEAGIGNLLDARYFTRRAEGYPGPGIIPSDARNFYITAEVRL